LDFGHSKFEAVALEDVKFKFKRQNPCNIVETHLSQLNMKWYMCEKFPYDEIFKGVKYYEEVQDRFQTPPQDQQVGFLSFQKNERNNLPKVLHEESIATPPSQEAMAIGSKSSHSGNHRVEGTPKGSRVLTQELKDSLSG
jgi:hypothetical protein